MYRILSTDTQIIMINHNTVEELDDEEVSKDAGMVVSGDILDEILENKTNIKRWIRLARLCKAVIICR